MAELERQASLSESPESERATTGVAYRSIRSSALTSLLPIATASGIVRADYNTPKISFYSPSGNLIQPEGSSSPEISTSTTGSPLRRILNYNKFKSPTAYHTLAASACSPPARPTLIPMTTSPAYTAPLPYHIRPHHNYGHPEPSQIDSYESLIEPTPPVKGCGGIIRARSSALHSGTRHLPLKTTKSRFRHKRRRSKKSVIHDLRSDVSFYKSRYIALATQSCAATRNSMKEKTLRKRQFTTSKRSKPLQHTSNPNQISALRKTTRGPRQKSVSVPLAGHALRICFCQPYDGAGEPTCMQQKPRIAQVFESEVAVRPVVMSRQGKRNAGTARQMAKGAGVGPKGA
jgi:hypothetical protein